LQACTTAVNEFLLFENGTENVGSQMGTIQQLELINGEEHLILFCVNFSA
jgi:hypothetical protein